jgi:hypothetical protein
MMMMKMVMVVVAMTTMKMIQMMIGLSGMKMTMISLRYHFVPHLVTNHLEADKCLFLHVNFFGNFFSLTLFDEIAAETNRYVSEKINKAMPLKKHFIWVGWEDVTTEELLAFHGVILNMARDVKSSVKDFFSEQWLDSSQFYKDIHSRKRFLQLYSGLHVSPPPRAEIPDRQMQSQASKVKNVTDYVQSKFLEFYSPTQYLSADVSTVNFKGCMVFKMYNPQKPTKWGLCIYVIADSTNGYVYVLIPYYGSITTKCLMHPELTFTSRIVLELISKVQNVTHEKGYHLYTDRFYTNLDLARELMKRKVHLTGTVQQNRKVCPNKCRKKHCNVENIK